MFQFQEHTNKLKDDDLGSRAMISTTSPNVVGLIECTSLVTSKLKRKCRGAIIAFSPDGSEDWYYGIISTLAVSNSTAAVLETESKGDATVKPKPDGGDATVKPKPDGVLSLYVWKGGTTLTARGCIVPSFYLDDKCNYRQHFSPVKHYPFRGNRVISHGRRGASDGQRRV